jgi:hypothetical protein
MAPTPILRRLQDLLQALGGLLAPTPEPRPIPIRVDDGRRGPRR